MFKKNVLTNVGIFFNPYLLKTTPNKCIHYMSAKVFLQWRTCIKNLSYWPEQASGKITHHRFLRTSGHWILKPNRPWLFPDSCWNMKNGSKEMGAFESKLFCEWNICRRMYGRGIFVQLFLDTFVMQVKSIGINCQNQNLS